MRAFCAATRSASSSNVEGERAWHPHPQRGERQDAGACADVEHRVRSRALHDLGKCLQAQRGRRVQASAERWGIDQPQRVRLPLHVRRQDAKRPDADLARAQHPHRSRVASDGRRHGEVVDAEHARDLVRRDAVGHQRGQPAAVHALDVERAELDEAVEGLVPRVGEVDSIRHGGTRRHPSPSQVHERARCYGFMR
jgi:hypothetical protein